MRSMTGLAVLLAACIGSKNPEPLKTGDKVPQALVGTVDRGLLFVTTVEDCFSCRIQGGFVALRAVQRGADTALAGTVTAVLISRKASDTAAFLQVLQNERIKARVVHIAPGKAQDYFAQERVPAIWLVAGGRILREWVPTKRGGVALERNDILHASSGILSAESK